MKAFEEYLPKWSEEKHLPIPTKNHVDKWNIAWTDFLTEYMEEHYEDIANEYRNLKTKADVLFTEESIFEEIEEEPVKKSNWELVQEKRKKKS